MVDWYEGRHERGFFSFCVLFSAGNAIHEKMQDIGKDGACLAKGGRVYR